MRFIEKLVEGETYHIYNRGINGEDIFKEQRNYHYFIEKYIEYCTPVLETYAYSLLKNHFHFLVRLKEKVILKRRDGNGVIKLSASKQLSHFFNCYAQSFNAAYNRHGKLFEEPFRRKPVDSDDYFTSLIYYIHFNPQQHQFVNDFKEWKFTSWHELLNNKHTFLEKEKVYKWFGSKSNFEDAHLGNILLNNISHLIIE